jgi:hypothetical protein
MPSSDPKKPGVRSGMGADRWQNDHTGPVAPSYTYDDLLRRYGSLLAFVRRDSGSGANSEAAAVAEPSNSGIGSANDRRKDAKTQLQSVLGAELSDGEATQLLERCSWDVQRAVSAHFDDELAAPSTARAAGNAEDARTGGVETLRLGTKRPAQSGGREQQKSTQRSILSMWSQR